MTSQSLRRAAIAGLMFTAFATSAFAGPATNDKAPDTKPAAAPDAKGQPDTHERPDVGRDTSMSQPAGDKEAVSKTDQSKADGAKPSAAPASYGEGR